MRRRMKMKGWLGWAAPALRRRLENAPSTDTILPTAQQSLPIQWPIINAFFLVFRIMFIDFFIHSSQKLDGGPVLYNGSMLCPFGKLYGKLSTLSVHTIENNSLPSKPDQAPRKTHSTMPSSIQFNGSNTS